MNKYLLIPAMLVITLFRVSAQTDTSVYAYQKPLFDFDQDRPTFKLENEQLSNKNKFLRASVLTGYREGVKPVDGGMLNFIGYTDPVTGTRRIYMYNLTIEEMMVHNTEWNPQSKVILEVKDPSRYRYDPKFGSKEAWMRKNAYCFEYTMPDGMMRAGVPGTLMGLAFEAELQHLFGIKVFREKRKVKLPGKEELAEVEFVVIREVNNEN